MTGRPPLCPYGGKFKPGQKVVLATVNDQDKEEGLEAGMRGTIIECRSHNMLDLKIDGREEKAYVDED